MSKKPLDLKKFIDMHRKIAGRTSHRGKRVQYLEAELEGLIDMARASFAEQSTLVEAKTPITFVGDIHGQFADLLRIFQVNGYPPKTRYIFLGDYVDRGQLGLECICLLVALKVAYPGAFYLLRGNHECQHINELYGFFDECNRRFNIALWKKWNDLFKYMPLAGLVAGEILCMHGGISPDLHCLDDIRNIQRPTVILEQGLKSDLLWADPEFGLRGFERSHRGISYVFGSDVVRGLCDKLGLSLIVRAHQVVQDGFQFFASKKLVTIFSAPNYCNEFMNKAALLNMDQALRARIVVMAEEDEH